MRHVEKAFMRKPGYGELGQRLKEERVRRGLKLNDFAAQVGVHVSSITAIENRGATPNFWLAAEICQVLDCTMDWLAGIGK
jgi:DNA-binding XRE family transcriptional regulator